MTISPELIERLAAIEHERWADWQQYVHECCESHPRSGLVIPATLVERWEWQIYTPYADLTEEEKESDREQVRRYLPVILELVAGMESMFRWVYEMCEPRAATQFASVAEWRETIQKEVLPFTGEWP